MTPEIVHYLKELSANNNRSWFNDNKAQFEKIKEDAQVFFNEIYEGVRKSDETDALKIYRIYRDVRFSKDKTPYKNHLSMYIGRKQPHNRGGYYLHIEPGNSFIGGGFFNPEKEDLFRIRKEIQLDGEAFLSIIHSKNFKKYFNSEIYGEALKTAPKDFDKNDPMIGYIRKKQFLLIRNFADKEILAADFTKEAVATFVSMRPFMNFMTNALTTNLNGESIL